jgi:gamma-glutamylputrescine oxidase
MSVSYWQDRALEVESLEADIVIVGTGLAGLSTKYWLHKLSPDPLRIVVLDKGTLGSGASGRNAGFITCGSTEHFSRMTSAYGENKAEEIWKFTEYNHELMVRELGESRLETLCDYRQRGSWTLAATKHEIETIRTTVGLLQQKGVDVTWFSKEDVERKLRCTGFYGGAYYAQDGEIDPLKYLMILATGGNYNKYHRNSLRLENREVFGIDSTGDRVVVKTNGLRIACQALVLCTNAWSGQLASFFQDKIAPTRGQIIATEPVEQFLEPAYCSFVLDYFRQTLDGRVLIGGFRNTDVEKEVGFSDEVNPLINEKLEGFLNEHFPMLRGKRIDYRWSGVMGFSKDGYPMVGSLTEDPRIFYNVGFTAHGLGFTFATGELTARLILEGQDPGIFSGRRFS